MITEMKIKWTPDPEWIQIDTIEMHTCGEPLRIVISGLPDISGSTILEKRRYFSENFDHIRTGLMFEPRGHADMYGAILTEPDTEDGDTGVFFFHNEGYSTMCGHAVIALTRLLSDSGIGERRGDEHIIKLDVPAGRITARAKLINDKIEKISFENVPSFVFLRDQEITTVTLGKIRYDIAYGGAFYAYVDAGQINTELNSNNFQKLIEAGREIKQAVMNAVSIEHPFEEDLGFLYGTIFIGSPHQKGNHSRNVCIFAEGELDRSPTGTGVSGRAALHFEKGELQIGESITIESILGTTMEVSIRETSDYGPYQAVVPEVSGKAWYTGSSKFAFDPEDPLKEGFIFR
jgi:trans-L-3-hydroxyproline dehydratase